MAPDSDHVVLVDEHDVALGEADKLVAHRPPGVLHRAVSAWLVDDRGRVLLQRRALSKYHFAGRWSNACCTHPRPGERPVDAVRRRLFEELGVRPEVTLAGSFVYRATDPMSAFVEHEVDHVFVGVLVDQPRPDPAEVLDLQLVEPEHLTVQLDDPDLANRYTPWLADVMAIASRAATT